MGYLNPLLQFGLRRAVQRCRSAGVDGLIVADLPYEEGAELERLCRSAGIALIYLLAPEIDERRTQAVVRASSGFVYCTALYGTTGSGGTEANLPRTLGTLRKMTDLPILVGFGVSSPEEAAAVCRHADGVIIGSWLIRTLEASSDPANTAYEFVRRVKQAVAAV